jgi:two-component system CheB/CheR fusion protein
VPARDGRWFNVRIMPYRTQDNRIDGVVITFFDISNAKVLEETLRETLAVLQSRLAPQTGALDRTQQLENLLAQAQAILEQRLASVNS